MRDADSPARAIGVCGREPGFRFVHWRNVGQHIAGAILANTTGSTFEVRGAAPNTTNRSYSFLATYRVI